MRSVLNAIYRLALVAIAALLGVLTIVVAYQVFGRYLPFLPRAIWTEEVSRLCLVWTVFLGAAVAVRRGDHFVIDIIPHRLDAKAARPLQLVVVACLLTASAVFIIGGLNLARSGVNQISTTSGIPLVWAYAAIPVTGILMAVFALEVGAKVLRNAPPPDFDARAQAGGVG